MKYKGMNENTIRRMLQSNETALLQKGVTDMLNTITNTTDSLLSSFSIEKFFSNKNFSDLSAFVKDILKQVENIANKAANVKIDSNLSMEKQIDDFMKEMKVSESNKLSNLDKSVIDFAKSLENKDEMEESNTAIFRKMILDSLDFFKQQFIDIGNRISSLYSSDSLISSISENLNKLSVNDDNGSKTTDYTEEQKKDEEKLRSERHINIAEKQISWLEGTLMPWLKEFGAESLSSDGFLATFFPMLATMINASPLLLKLIGFAKMFLGIGGAIFGIWKFVEGINQAVDVLGHEIDFTKLDGWIQALNLGLGNIVSAITGIDLKTVYNWLNNFDKTLEHAYQRYLEPIVGSLWNSIKKMLNPFITKIQEGINTVINDFVKKYPGLAEIIENIYKYFSEEIIPFIKNNYKEIFEALGQTFKDISDFTKRGFNLVVNPLGLGKDFEMSFDTLVNAVVDIATTMETLWEFGQKLFGTFSEQTLTDFLSGDAWINMGLSAGEGIKEAIENYEKKREEKMAFIKGGSIGVEQLGLTREMEYLEKRKEYLGGVRTDIANEIEDIINENKWGGSYDKLSNMIAELYESENDSQIQSLSTILKEKLTGADLNKLMAESDNDKERFFEAVKNQMYDITDPYIKRFMERKQNSINEKYQQYQMYEDMKNPQLEAVKDASKQLGEDTMSVQEQAINRNEELKQSQGNINANNVGNTYVDKSQKIEQTVSPQSGVNEQKQLSSASQFLLEGGF